MVGDYYDGGYCNLGLNSAYIYHRNQGGANAWGQAAELTPNDVVARDGFGVGVSLSGDTAVVGAWGADVGGKIDQGAAYVFSGIRANRPPVAEANGPYDVLAGGTVPLSGAGSSDPDAGDTLTYAWDLDGDTIYGETGPAAARGDELGATPTFSAVDLNAPLALTVRLRVTDPGGLSSDDATTVIVADATPPVITPDVSGTLGSNDWYVGDVAVSWKVTDGESAVTATDGCDPTTVSADTTGVTFTCSATSAGGSSSQSVTIKLDKTGPSANLAVTAGTPGLESWYTGDVAVSTSGSDDISGPVTCTAAQSQTTDTPGTEFNGSCVNDAGLSTAAAPLTVKRDATPPVITWNGGPADGGAYVFGSVPAAPTCTATDATSGPNGCTVAGYGTAVGSHTLTATAYDVAGNSTIETRAYTVVAWMLEGFYPPVEMNGVYNSAKGGSIIPVKFEIFAGSTELTDVAAVKSLTYAQTDCGANTISAESAAEAAGGTGLRYDPKNGQFIYNWKTPKIPGACLRLTLTTQDLSTLVAYFKLK